VEQNTLLDQFLPEFEFNEVHSLTVNASPHQVFIAIRELTSAELSPLIFGMLNLRNLPARLLGKETSEISEVSPFLDQLYQGGFIPLGELAGNEIVFGLIGQFWKLTGGKEPAIAGPEAFLAFDDPTCAKVAANLKVSPEGKNGLACCSTETRIHVFDPQTRRKFAFYWRLISLGSGWIRILWLRAIKRKAEAIPDK
jgi:hypothetical protein